MQEKRSQIEKVKSIERESKKKIQEFWGEKKEAQFKDYKQRVKKHTKSKNNQWTIMSADRV